MSAWLNYYKTLDGKLSSLQVSSEDSPHSVVSAICLRERWDGISEPDLVLYTSKTPVKADKEGLLALGQTTPDDWHLVDAPTLVQTVFEKGAPDESLVHFVITLAAPLGWEVEGSGTHWKDFYRYWRSKDTNETLERDVLPLAFDDRGYDDPSYCLVQFKETSGLILVLKAYKDLFKRTLTLQSIDRHRGVVLIGQPGTGKTVWLWFMLICLLTKDEVVAFYKGGVTRLFYNGQVYVTREIPTSGFPRDLTGRTGRTIWCLIDSDPRVEPPPYALVKKASLFFPIQASSPKSKRYKEWVKQRNGSTWGMALWSREELKAGARLHSGYVMLLDSLQAEFQNSPNENANPLITQRAREIVAEVGDDFAGISDVHKRAETILDWLLEWNIVEFGQTPRDVYRALLEPSKIKETIERSVDEASLEDLIKIMRVGLSSDSTMSDTSPTHKIISISPVPTKTLTGDDKFEAKFRSAHVRTVIIKRIALLQHEEAKRISNIYRSIPQTGQVAGNIFEGLAHRVLCGMDPGSLSGSLMPMEESKQYKGLFSTPLGSAQSQFSLPVRRRQYTLVSTKQKVGQSLLSWFSDDDKLPPLEQRFCVPTAQNNALFDSFFIEFDRTEDSITPIIWIFQVTISTKHDGSKRGYPKINLVKDEAVGHASQLAECRDEEDISGRKQKRRKMEVKAVEVNYVLVCTTPQKWHSWKVPNGWNSQDNVFCQFIKI